MKPKIGIDRADERNRVGVRERICFENQLFFFDGGVLPEGANAKTKNEGPEINFSHANLRSGMLQYTTSDNLSPNDSGDNALQTPFPILDERRTPAPEKEKVLKLGFKNLRFR
jgi:hypothetical protein